MQSRLAALFLGVASITAAVCGLLAVESARRISLEQNLQRNQEFEQLTGQLEQLQADQLDNIPILLSEAAEDSKFDNARQTQHSIVFVDGNPIATSGPQAEDRFDESASNIVKPEDTIYPWNEGFFAASASFQIGAETYELQTITRTDRTQTLVSGTWTLIVAGFVTVTLLLLALSYPLSRWVMRPARQLGSFAEKIADGDFGARAPQMAGAADLQQLTKSFNHIADQLLASLQREQLFVASASHHFGNLLTPLRIRVESMNQQNSMVQETLAELDRLEAAAQRLIHLSQAEEGQLTPIELDIVPIVEQTVQSWQPVTDFSNVELTCSLPKRAVAWVIPGAIEEILDNLIDNAVKYGNESPVTVRVILGLSHVQLSVTDRGPGLQEDQIEKAYGRFWRGSEHQNQHGSGLGLSIVRALAARSESEFKMRNVPQGGLEASLALRRFTQQVDADASTVDHRPQVV